MNCYFCQTQMNRTRTINVYTCPKCPYSTDAWSNDCNEIVGILFTYETDSTRYQFIFNLQDNQFQIFRYQIIFNLQDNQFQILKGIKLIVRWKFIPNITPQNVREKLPTILTFL